MHFETMKRNKKYIFIVTLVLVLIGLGVYHDMRSVAGSNDFDTYFLAGKLAKENSNLYTDKAFSSTTGPYLYLPFFAVLIAPLTFLPFRAASVLWYLFGVLVLCGSFAVSVKLIMPKKGIKEIFFTKPYLIKIIAVVFLAAIWLDNMSLAQVDFIMFFMIVLSLFSYDKKRPFSSGIIMAAASVIKIYPAYFLIYFIAKKRFKAVVGFFIGIFVFMFLVPFLVMGKQNFSDSMKSWQQIKVAPYMQAPAERVEDNFTHFESLCKPSNQSLPAVVTRYLVDYEYRHKKDISEWIDNNVKQKIPTPINFSPRTVDVIVKVLYLVIFIVTFAGLDYGGRYKSRTYLSLEYSLMMLSMILFFPVVQTHMYASLMFPIIVFICLKTRNKEGRIYGNKGIEIMFYSVFGLYALQAFKYMKILGAGCFSIILLWILFAIMLRKEKYEERNKIRSSDTIN